MHVACMYSQVHMHQAGSMGVWFVLIVIEITHLTPAMQLHVHVHVLHTCTCTCTVHVLSVVVVYKLIEPCPVYNV